VTRIRAPRAGHVRNNRAAGGPGENGDGRSSMSGPTTARHTARIATGRCAGRAMRHLESKVGRAAGEDPAAAAVQAGWEVARDYHEVPQPGCPVVVVEPRWEPMDEVAVGGFGHPHRRASVNRSGFVGAGLLGRVQATSGVRWPVGRPGSRRGNQRRRECSEEEGQPGGTKATRWRCVGGDPGPR
jgi:hypothetical protein